jgi:redox-sensing transcriptional repressor
MKDNKSEGIPKRVIQRIPIYFRYLQNLDEAGIDRVSSRELADKVGVSASQLRHDLHYFGAFGQQGYAYQVGDLLIRIKKIMGLNRRRNMVLVGAGHLGMALSSYGNFAKRGFDLVGIFDVDPEVVGTRIQGITVSQMDGLHEFLKRHHVEIGIITVPPGSAQQVADKLVAGGVTAIWNFAPVRLIVPEGIIVEHLHLIDSLIALAFQAELQR